MTALVACETVLLVLLVLLVAGLLRSHAEILRRLGPPEAEQPGVESQIPRPGSRAEARKAHDIVGETLEGDAVKVALGEGAQATLLAFLSSGCSVCEGFWSDLRQRRTPGAGIRLIALTKDPSRESASRLRRLAGERMQVIMSSEAWRAYGVPAAPYFAYVDEGAVLGEGSATGWIQIESLLRDAIGDHASDRSGDGRAREVDRVLAATGIGPGHPSLYPGRGAGHADAGSRPK